MNTQVLYNLIPHIADETTLQNSTLTGGYIYLSSNTTGTGFYLGSQNVSGLLTDFPIVIISNNGIAWVQQSYYLASLDISNTSLNDFQNISVTDTATIGQINATNSTISGTNKANISINAKNILYYGADGSGATDSTTAIQNCINAGLGLVYIPKGTYLVNGSLTIPDNLKITSDEGGILNLGNSIIIGSTTAISDTLDIDINIQAQSTLPVSIPLIEVYNVGNSTISARLTAAATSNDFIHIHSTNAKGSYDTIYHLTTGNNMIKNGISLINGNSTIASVAGDFVNGNLFFKCDIAAVVNGITAQSLGSYTGSVDAPIAHNKFDRCDINSYNSYGFTGFGSGAQVGYNSFYDCTFETGSGGATHDVNLTGNINGNYFYNTIARNYATQLLNPNDIWINGINDFAQYYGLSIPLQSIPGRTAGNIYYSFPAMSPGYKKVCIHFNNYENNTPTSDTINMPMNWQMPLGELTIINNGALSPSISANSISFDPNNTTVYTGTIIIEGF